MVSIKLIYDDTVDSPDGELDYVVQTDEDFNAIIASNIAVEAGS